MTERICIVMPEYDRSLLAAISLTMWRFGIRDGGIGFDTEDGSVTAVYNYPVDPPVFHRVEDVLAIL